MILVFAFLALALIGFGVLLGMSLSNRIFSRDLEFWRDEYHRERKTARAYKYRATAGRHSEDVGTY